MTKDAIECHELALAVPEMTDVEYQELLQSIKENGQREPGIMLDGKVLDGRHRSRACEELDIPFAYRPYDIKRDGIIPEMVVLDANIRRRHLSAGQKAAIGAELSEKIKEEKAKIKAMSKAPAGANINGKTAVIAADKVGASHRSVQRAEKLKKDDPAAFDEVKSGNIKLNTAVEKTERQKLSKGLIEKHEGEFIEAIDSGALLKTTKELKEFTQLNEADQKAIWKMVAKGWTVKKALRYIKEDMDNDSTIKDLVLRAMDTPEKNHFTCVVAGWEISATKI